MAPQFLCLAQQSAKVGQVTCHRARGTGLHQDVAERRGLGRARHHGQPARVRRQPAQQLVAGAAADDVHGVDRTAGKPLGVHERAAVGQGQ